MAYKTKILIALLLLLSAFGSIYGQIRTPYYSLSLRAGTSLGLHANEGSVFGGGIHIYTLSKKMLSMNYNRKDELDFSFFEGVSPYERINEMNVLYGHYVSTEWLRFEFQLGLALVWGTARGDRIYPQSSYADYKFMTSLFSTTLYEEIPFTTVGFPFRVGLKFTPWKNLSLGMELQGNINNYSSSFSNLFCIEIGVMPMVPRKKIVSD